MSMLYTYACDDNTTCHPTTVTLNRGRYLIECYGAQGGTGLTESAKLYPGGKGAYASGVLNLKKSTTLYLYIGGRGEDGINAQNKISKGGWNGGGDSGEDNNLGGNAAPDSAGAGGGCTDVRLIKATEDENEDTANDEESDIFTNEASLNSRIIVAAGGSGSCYGAYGAPGGDLTGYKLSAGSSYVESGTSQIDGFQKGRGENGQDGDVPSSGAGAGYYGGKKGTLVDNNFYPSVSSSGSSYVAGYPECPQYSDEELGSVFGNKLFNPHIASGFSVFPSLEDGQSEKGHEGNGAVKITQLEVCTVCTERRSNIIMFVVVFVLSNNRNSKVKTN